VTTPRKLEEIASSLDDMSLTLEEIKEEVTSTDRLDTAKLDQVQAEIEKATEAIEASIEPQERTP
jgi:hypothetical protein